MLKSLFEMKVLSHFRTFLVIYLPSVAGAQKTRMMGAMYTSIIHPPRASRAIQVFFKVSAITLI